MKRALALAAAATALLAAGCGSSGGSTGGAADTNASVSVRLTLEPTSLDITKVAGAALEQALIGNVYEGLVKLGDDGSIKPDLAALPKVSDDGLTYTFALNKATFHDGSPVTAADVKSSFDAVTAKNSTNPAKSGFAAVKDVTATGDDTVRIRLSHRDSTFPFALAGRAGIVLRKGATNDLGSTENGTGPFRLKNWQRGSAITLVRDDAYWGEKARVAQVVLRYIPDENAALNALRTGDVDVFVSPTADQLAVGRSSGTYAVSTGTSSTIYVLGFNNSRGPLKDARVRHALRQAVDKDGLIKALGGSDLYARTGSHTTTADPWFEDLTSTDGYNPENARKLLADAGHGSGLNLELTVSNIYPTAISDYLVAQYKAVGVNLKVNRVEFATWLDKAYTKADYDLSLVAHVEPLTILNYADPHYYWRYDSGDVQTWTADALGARTDAERDGLLKKVAERLAADAPADWLFYSRSVALAKHGVSGFPKNDTNNRLDLSALTKTG